MKKRTKIIIGVILVFFLLIIISNKNKEIDLSDLDTKVGTPNGEKEAQQPSINPGQEISNSELEALQQELENLQNKINELEAEDLGGLSE